MSNYKISCGTNTCAACNSCCTATSPTWTTLWTNTASNYDWLQSPNGSGTITLSQPYTNFKWILIINVHEYNQDNKRGYTLINTSTISNMSNYGSGIGYNASDNDQANNHYYATFPSTNQIKFIFQGGWRTQPIIVAGTNYNSFGL